VTLGAVAFAVTDIDDLVLLALWFSQPGRRVTSIVIGPYLGIGALVVVSAVAVLLSIAVPLHWLVWMGLLPIALGIRLLLKGGVTDTEDGATTVATSPMAVAGVTIANGGDNLGVYVPLFASQPDATFTYILIFAVGTAVWCGLGYALVSHPVAANSLQRWGHRILPWALMAIGFHILLGEMGSDSRPHFE
jgi:cadmium resistance protein CadD (predicted permease)